MSQGNFKTSLCTDVLQSCGMERHGNRKSIQEIMGGNDKSKTERKIKIVNICKVLVLPRSDDEITLRFLIYCSLFTLNKEGLLF